ncbi:MAG TPA: hypothetical protein VM577_12010 [Anaerovoracaceae bacterium]|nr:hypothetical protein [Anaerovoracaceae bacterium]
MNQYAEEKIKSIVVKEFKGIDHLPDLLTALLDYNSNKQEG